MAPERSDNGEPIRLLMLEEMRRRRVHSLPAATARELLAVIGKKSVSCVTWHLSILERQGRIVKTGRRGRGETWSVVI